MKNDIYLNFTDIDMMDCSETEIIHFSQATLERRKNNKRKMNNLNFEDENKNIKKMNTKIMSREKEGQLNDDIFTAFMFS